MHCYFWKFLSQQLNLATDFFGSEILLSTLYFSEALWIEYWSAYLKISIFTLIILYILLFLRNLHQKYKQSI